MSIVTFESDSTISMKSDDALQPLELSADMGELHMSELDDVSGGCIPLAIFALGFLVGRGAASVYRDGI